uniref:Coiled-coil domain-containing protein 70 n=1 Tax=Salvator merianae TaxID=96440 RepID=A0A8D0BPZ6_SALMN
ISTQVFRLLRGSPPISPKRESWHHMPFAPTGLQKQIMQQRLKEEKIVLQKELKAFWEKCKDLRVEIKAFRDDNKTKALWEEIHAFKKKNKGMMDEIKNFLEEKEEIATLERRNESFRETIKAFQVKNKEFQEINKGMREKSKSLQEKVEHVEEKNKTFWKECKAFWKKDKIFWEEDMAISRDKMALWEEYISHISLFLEALNPNEGHKTLSKLSSVC